MTQCATMITDHLDRNAQCDREENHAGSHLAKVVTDGEVQHVLAHNRELDKNVIPHSLVVTIKPDDVMSECKSCGISYVKREFMGDYCTQCSFWLSKAGDFKKSRSKKITGSEKAFLVTRDYECFSLCPTDKRGFSGAYFSVGLLDSDEIVKIKGPWHCGIVPLHLRDEFEPNVRFVTLEK